MGGYDGLRPLTGQQIGAKSCRPGIMAVFADRERQRGACIMMPDLGCIDLVPRRDFACGQQKVDRGGVRADVLFQSGLIAEGLAKMPPLRGVV
jgi:hypothetical protein